MKPTNLLVVLIPAITLMTGCSTKKYSTSKIHDHSHGAHSHATEGVDLAADAGAVDLSSDATIIESSTTTESVVVDYTANSAAAKRLAALEAAGIVEPFEATTTTMSTTEGFEVIEQGTYDASIENMETIETMETMESEIVEGEIITGEIIEGEIIEGEIIEGGGFTESLEALELPFPGPVDYSTESIESIPAGEPVSATPKTINGFTVAETTPIPTLGEDSFISVEASTSDFAPIESVITSEPLPSEISPAIEEPAPRVTTPEVIPAPVIEEVIPAPALEPAAGTGASTDFDPTGTTAEPAPTPTPAPEPAPAVVAAPIPAPAPAAVATDGGDVTGRLDSILGDYESELNAFRQRAETTGDKTALNSEFAKSFSNFSDAWYRNSKEIKALPLDSLSTYTKRFNGLKNDSFSLLRELKK